MRKLAFLLLAAAVFSVAATNLSPNKFLLGWDNLLPEFNLLLNLKRTFFAVWQNEALGFLGGNGHAAELPRQLMLLPLSFLPLNLIRQVFMFLMLGVGTLGAFMLIKNLVHFKSNSLKNAVPLLGALFYLFNLATVQTFYAPLEPFIVHFAFLPWLLLTTLLFIANKSRKSLIFFLIINFLAASQAQVPTIFVVYVFSLSFFLLILCLETKRRDVILNSVKILGFTLIINAFWLLPFLYFVITNSSVAFTSKINQMATETVFLQNKEFGNLTDTMLLKGFWFNNVDPNFEGKFDYMLLPWKEHLQDVSLIGFGFFAVILFGFITVTRRSPFVLPFSALFLLSITMLLTNTPPFSWIDSFLRDIPLFGQAFRFPFTKFSILAALTYSFFFAVGIGKIMEKIKLQKSHFLFIPVVILMIIFVFPIFKGQLFYEKERVNFPSEYQQVFHYFSSKPPTSRIANFPQHTFWGWNYYRWGYGGSGFLWYSLPQPIMDRAFDVWSNESENYYWEINRAIYSQNAPLFESVLGKYNIEYILLDKNVVSTSSERTLFTPELEDILSSIRVTKEVSFGRIDIYKVGINPSSLKAAKARVNRYEFGDYDRAYFELGDYISVPPEEADVVYPFRSLFSGKTDLDKEYAVSETQNSLIFESKKTKHTTEVPKLGISFNLNTQVRNCDNFRSGTFSRVQGEKNTELRSSNATACISGSFDISSEAGYLLALENKNIKGRPLHVWIQNETGSYTLIDTYLPENKTLETSYFVIPPQDEFSRTYSLNFNNISLGDDETVNELGNVSIYQIPYDTLTSLRFGQTGKTISVLDSNQAFDEGWKAYRLESRNFLTLTLPFVFGKELEEHVLLNNWSNGWVLDSETTKKPNNIVIVYLPQYLQYLGYTLLIGFSVFVFKYREKNY